MAFKVWLVWAPASGKTTITEMIKERWYIVFPEAATELVKLELLKWTTKEIIFNNLIKTKEFQDHIHEKKIEQYQMADNIDGFVFFDSTFIDDIAHRQMFGLELENILTDIFSRRYDQVFFIKHPLKNQHRILDDIKLKEASTLDSLKREALNISRYNSIEVPTTEELLNNHDISPSKRVDFILSKLWLGKE